MDVRSAGLVGLDEAERVEDVPETGRSLAPTGGGGEVEDRRDKFKRDYESRLEWSMKGEEREGPSLTLLVYLIGLERTIVRESPLCGLIPTMIRPIDIDVHLGQRHTFLLVVSRRHEVRKTL